MSNVTHPNEFGARLIARQRMIEAGAKAQAKAASRLAAQLYKAGRPMYQAVREAVQQCRPAHGIGGGAA